MLYPCAYASLLYAVLALVYFLLTTLPCPFHTYISSRSRRGGAGRGSPCLHSGRVCPCRPRDPTSNEPVLCREPWRCHQHKQSRSIANGLNQRADLEPNCPLPPAFRSQEEGRQYISCWWRRQGQAHEGRRWDTKDANKRCITFLHSPQFHRPMIGAASL